MFKFLLITAAIGVAAAGVLDTKWMTNDRTDRSRQFTQDAGFETIDFDPVKRMSFDDLMKQKFLLTILDNVQQPGVTGDVCPFVSDTFVMDQNKYKKGIDVDMMFVMELGRNRGQLKRGNFCSMANVEHLRQMIGLQRIFACSQDWETFRQNVCFARREMNEVLFVNALLLAVRQREDTRRLVIPAIHEILPQWYLDSDIIRAAQTIDLNMLTDRTIERGTTKPNFFEMMGLSSRMNAINTFGNPQINDDLFKTNKWMPWRQMRMQMAMTKTQNGNDLITSDLEDKIVIPVDRTVDITRDITLLTNDVGLKGFIQLLMDDLCLRENDLKNTRIGRVNLYPDTGVSTIDRQRITTNWNGIDRSDRRYRDIGVGQNRFDQWDGLNREFDDTRSGDVMVDLPTTSVDSDKLLHINYRRLQSIGNNMRNNNFQTGNDQLGSDRWGTEKIYTDRWGTNQMDTDRWNTDKIATDRWGSDQWRSGQRDTDKRANEKWGTTQWGTDRWGTDKMNTDRWNTGIWGTNQMDTDRWNTDKIRTDRWDSDQRGFGQSNTDRWAKEKNGNTRWGTDRWGTDKTDTDRWGTSKWEQRKNTLNDRFLTFLRGSQISEGRRVTDQHKIGQFSDIDDQNVRFNDQRRRINSNSREDWDDDRTLWNRMFKDDDVSTTNINDDRNLDKNRRRFYGMDNDMIESNFGRENLNTFNRFNGMTKRRTIENMNENTRSTIDGLQTFDKTIPRTDVLLHNLRQLVARIENEKISLGIENTNMVLNDMIFGRNDNGLRDVRDTIQSILNNVNIRTDLTDALTFDQIIANTLLKSDGRVNVLDVFRDILTIGQQRQDNRSAINMGMNLNNPLVQKVLKTLCDIVELQRTNVLGPYTRRDLTLDGVTVNNVIVDQLKTFTDLYDIDVRNLLDGRNVLTGDQQKMVVARVQRLNHKDFTIQIDLDSDRNRQVMIRTFLGPKFSNQWGGQELQSDEIRQKFMLIDSTIVNLETGKNVIKRKSRDMEWTARDTTPLTQIYKRVLMGLDGRMNAETFMWTEKIAGQDCRFPHRLIIPRGRVNGIQMQMFVIVTDVETGTTIVRNDLTCAMGVGTIISDGRSLGFPLDRRVDNIADMINLPNIKITDVVVRHEERAFKGF